MAEAKVGTVTHFFNKISVAVIKLEAALAVGETVKIVGHGKEFVQKVESMQIEHESIKKASKGDEVAIKVTEPVKEKDEVFKVVEQSS